MVDLFLSLVSVLHLQYLQEAVQQSQGQQGQGQPWRTYPGLFAGGGLDVMTTALLRALPAPPVGGAVLDAAVADSVASATSRFGKCAKQRAGAGAAAAGSSGSGGTGKSKRPAAKRAGVDPSYHLSA